MKFQVLQEELAKALSYANRFASVKAQLPVLGNILFSAKKSKLIVASTNLEISISVAIGAKIEEEGEITIPAKVISDIVVNLNPGQITLAAKEESLKIISSDFESTILGMNSSDFPKVPKRIEKIDFSISKDDLSNALSYVLFAVSADETRPILTGVLFSLKKEGLTIVSTDGFRLSQRILTLHSVNKSFNLILPKLVLSELVRFPTENNIDFSFDKANNQVIFKLDNIILSSRILEGDFPDYQKIIPEEFTVKTLVDKEDLGRAVKLASVFAKDSANVIKINIGDDNLEINAESQLSGKGKTKIDAKIEGEELQIAFNYRFLEELLQVIEGEDVQIQFSGSSSPALFKDPKSADFLHIIMPVKLQD